MQIRCRLAVFAVLGPGGESRRTHSRDQVLQTKDDGKDDPGDTEIDDCVPSHLARQGGQTYNQEPNLALTNEQTKKYGGQLLEIRQIRVVHF
jgi:hypothetical protein